MIKKLIAECPKYVDLTDEQNAEQVFGVAQILLDSKISIHEIEEIQRELIAQKDNSLVFILLVLKIVKSKILLEKITKPLTVSVVFAVYKEHNRIKKNSEHPHGEDFISNKVKQLEWLFAGKSNIKWELIVVDDGCPEDSGGIAQKIIAQNQLSDKVRVLYLADAIAQNNALVDNLSTASDSQKGGAIVYGMREAVASSGAGEHIIVYTDADLSTHLGQLALLLDPIVNQDKLVAIGSRREPDSVVVKKETRNDRGKLFIYIWKRLIPNLDNIVDTQCGFKAFNSKIIPKICANLIEKKFAFDIELLIRAELIEKDTIIKIPIAMIDSEEASTTTDLNPYLSMLKSIVKMNKKYFPDNVNNIKVGEFAQFIESLTEDDWSKLLQNIPENITKREPSEFTKYDEVTIAELKTCLYAQKS